MILFKKIKVKKSMSFDQVFPSGSGHMSTQVFYRVNSISVFVETLSNLDLE